MVKARIPPPVEFIDRLKGKLHLNKHADTIPQGLSSEEKTDPTSQPMTPLIYYTALFFISMEVYMHICKEHYGAT